MRNTYTERLKEKLKEALQTVLIVVPTAQKNQIMKAIMEQAGLASNAKAIAFSLPVTATAGMRLMEEEPEQV